MRVLYKRTDKDIPDNFEYSVVTGDILRNFTVDKGNLFSVTQIAERNQVSRGHVQRQIRRLVKVGLVERWSA